MPTYGGELDWKYLKLKREHFTKVLVAKGLREGEGKFGAVLERYMRKPWTP